MSNSPETFSVLRTKTAPGLLAEHARGKPDAVAFRAKHLGLYRERTWRPGYETVTSPRRRSLSARTPRAANTSRIAAA